MTDEDTPNGRPKNPPGEPQPHPEDGTEEKECPECGRIKEIPVYADDCASCAEGKAFAQIEAPEGGWPRGSDMDRI